MTFCGWCGAAIPPGDRFCSRCGRPVAGVVPPARANGAVPILLILVVVVIVAFGVISAVLYNLTSGFVGTGPTSSKPVITLTVSKISGGADVLVAGIQPAAAPGNFKVNLEDVSTGTFGPAANLPATPGLAFGLTIGSGGTGSTTFSIVWQNPSGSGLVSQGDQFVITHVAGDYTSGITFAFILIWSDGSILTSIQWMA